MFMYKEEVKAETFYFPYKIFKNEKCNYYSILKYYKYNSINQYTLQNYILKDLPKKLFKINTYKPPYAFIVRKDDSIIYVSKNEVRIINSEGIDTLLNDKSEFLIDIKEDTEGNIIVLDKHTSLLKKINKEGEIINITDGFDIIYPNSFVIVENGYLIGDRQYVWFIQNNGSKIKVITSYTTTINAIGYDNLYLRGKKIAFTYQNDDKTTLEICEYDSMTKKYYYLLNEKRFEKLSKKKSNILQGFTFKNDKLIFWTEKGFSK